jgi:hypothetical protein
VIGHPAKENTHLPMFGCDDFEAMRQAAVEGLGIAFLPDWVAGDDINSGALVQLFPNWTSNRICPQESMRYAHYVTRLPESRCFSTHCVSSSDTLQNGQRVAVSHEEQLTLRTCKGRRHDPPVGQRDFLFRAYSCWSPLLWFSSVYLTGGWTALLHQKRKILRIDRC